MKSRVRRILHTAAGAVLTAGSLTLINAPSAQAEGDCAKTGTITMGWHPDSFAIPADGTDEQKKAFWAYLGHNSFTTYKTVGKGRPDNSKACIAQVHKLLKEKHCDKAAPLTEKDFGSQTQAAVSALQKQTRRWVIFGSADDPAFTMIDGVVGPQTWALLQGNYPGNTGAVPTDGTSGLKIKCNGK